METTRAMQLVEQIRPILAGEDPAVQGAALADLLAMFLAGHVVVGSPEESEGIREAYLTMHIEMVRKLIPLNYKAIIEPQLKDKLQ